MKASHERRMRQVIARWKAGGKLTAAERRQVRKMAGLPKAAREPRRVTYDELHPGTELEQAVRELGVLIDEGKFDPIPTKIHAIQTDQSDKHWLTKTTQETDNE